MKKSYLNTAINVALTSIVLSSLVLQTQANASTTDNVTNSTNNEASSELNISDNSNSNNNDISNSNISNSNNSKSDTYLYPGMGVGAATGTLIAGPVGFIVGGAIGALIGVNQDVETEQTENSDSQITSDDSQHSVSDNNAIVNSTTDTSTPGNNKEVDNVALQSATAESLTAEPIQVAQTGSFNPAIIETTDTPQGDLMNILVSDLSLDVYFRSGSTDIEKFYPARLTAIANLANSMDKLELHLDGYTDRRGDKDQNIALANTRIERVREQLINAGVSPERIVSKAFGEAKMKSTAGNLEAYTFDRRVVIRFERISNIDNTMDTALSDTENTNDLTTGNEKSADETISDEVSSGLPLAEIDDTARDDTETAESIAGSVTIDPKTNPAVADATNRF